MIQGELNTALRATLASLGFQIQAQIGGIVSGSIPASRLLQLAAIAQIQFIELPASFEISPPPLPIAPTAGAEDSQADGGQSE